MVRQRGDSFIGCFFFLARDAGKKQTNTPIVILRDYEWHSATAGNLSKRPHKLACMTGAL